MDNMIDEHIKDYSQKYECPKGKLYCEYGESDCKYFKGRFDAYACDNDLKEKIEEGHSKELEERQAININWDYKPQLDKMQKG